MWTAKPGGRIYSNHWFLIGRLRWVPISFCYRLKIGFATLNTRYCISHLGVGDIHDGVFHNGADFVPNNNGNQ